MLTRPIVMIISQYTQIVTHVAHLKLTMLYVNYTSIKNAKKNPKTLKDTFQVRKTIYTGTKARPCMMGTLTGPFCSNQPRTTHNSCNNQP